jgi:hypothetical protein
MIVQMMADQPGLQDLQLLCGVCQENQTRHAVIALACHHHYCRNCLQTTFEGAFADEQRFPPRRCDQPIPVPPADGFLSPEIMRIYHEKKIEFGTVNRIYCSAPSCSTFIRPEDITEGRAICRICAVETCIACKTGSHAGECPKDRDFQLLLETGVFCSMMQ